MFLIEANNCLSLLLALDKQLLDNSAIHLQGLLKSLSAAIDEIAKCQQKPEFKPFSLKIKLCVSQLSKVLPYLVNILSNNNPLCNKETIGFILEKTRWCLLEATRMFNGGGIEDDMEPCGLFVKSIDNAISIIHKEEFIANDNYKSLIDDLLCQALTIAKLSVPQDHDEITAACKNVLINLSRIQHSVEHRECSKSSYEENHRKELFLFSLETLERRVNTAVLRLYLNVMSQPFSLIKEVVAKCFQKKSSPRHVKDLNDDIVNLDQYCEQVQLIGNFAVACTESKQAKLMILCCLASLEFCENYLIPSILSFYVDPSNLNKQHFFKFLSDECQKELMQLQTLMDNIVDSPAFTQVAAEDLNILGHEIKDGILERIFNGKSCERFLHRCCKVIKHLQLTDDVLVQKDSKVIEELRHLESVVKEYHYLLRVNIFDELTIDNFIEKSEIILTSINKISVLLNKPNITYDNCNSTSRLGRSHFQDTPMKIGTSTSINYLNKGKERDRTKFLQDSLISNKAYNSANPLEPYLTIVAETPRKVTLYIKPPTTPFLTKTVNKTFYDVSDVLEDLSRLPSAFSVLNESRNPGSCTHFASEQAAIKDVSSETEKETTPKSHLQSYSVNTQQRLRDIETLDKKIFTLKLDYEK